MSRSVVDNLILLNANGNPANLPLLIAQGGAGGTDIGDFFCNSATTLGVFRSLPAVGGTLAQLPVILGPNGLPLDTAGSAPIKIVVGSGVLPAFTSGSGVFQSALTVTLTNASIFTNAGTYFVFAQLNIGTGTNGQVEVYTNRISASQFTLAGVSPTAIGAVTVFYLAIGY